MAGSILASGTSTQHLFINFIFGLLFGSVVTYIGLKFSNSSVVDELYVRVLERENPFLTLIADPHGDTHAEVNDGNKVSLQESQRFSAHKDALMLGEDALGDWMSRRIRILCWIMTNPGNLDKKAIHVKATWAKRCNIVLFISSQNTDFPTIAVVDHEGREYLWQKTRGAFDHIYKHYLDKADWFLKADDDTYVIVENMRKLVSLYDPEKPIYFGRKFKPYVKQGYMSGGAGYVLSRKAVELLVEKGFKDTKLCKSATHVGGAEDVEIGRCLMNVGVEAGDSRDDIYETFHPFVMQQMVVPNILPRKFWYFSYNFYPVKEGPECCSDYSISFHYVPPNMMYQLEFMVYHMRPFGVGYYMCPAEIRTIIGLPEAQPPAEPASPIEGEKIKFVEKKEPEKKPEEKPESGKEQESEKKKESKKSKESEKKEEAKEETKVVVDIKAQDKEAVNG